MGEFPSFERLAKRRLDILRSARRLDDLRANPANRLHPLGDERPGLYGIRINDRWRVCFRWQDDAATDVEIAEYERPPAQK